MHDFDVALIAAFVLGFGLVSKALGRTPLTAPILAVAFGILMGPGGLDAIHFRVEHDESILLLAEFTLALLLFHDASRIDLGLLRRNLGAPRRLLTLGLVGTIVLGFGIGLLMLEGLEVIEVALLAALLAPTDAALGQAVVTQESVPIRVRQALNVESGLNDGLVVPVVAIIMAFAAGADAETGGVGAWIEHAARVGGFGVGVGAAAGFVAAKLLDAGERAGWMEVGAQRGAVAAVPVAAFFTAEALEGSGFLAAFVAGLVLGGAIRALPRKAFHFNEEAGELIGLVTWIAFGVAAVPYATHCFDAATIIYALLSLTVIRILPVALALAGSGLRLDTRLFMGWFGPRGLATVVFAITVLHEDAIAGGTRIFGVATWTVLLSVLLHGLTAGALARRFGARCADRPGGEGIPDRAPA